MTDYMLRSPPMGRLMPQTQLRLSRVGKANPRLGTR